MNSLQRLKEKLATNVPPPEGGLEALEYRRHLIVEGCVEAVTEIVDECSRGSRLEENLILSSVAMKLFEQLHLRNKQRLMKEDMTGT